MDELTALKKINIFLTKLTNNRRNCSKNGLTLEEQEFDWEHNYIGFLEPMLYPNSGLDENNEVIQKEPIPAYDYEDKMMIPYPEMFGFPDLSDGLLTAIYEHLNWKCSFKVDEQAETIELFIGLYLTPKVGYKGLNRNEPTITVTYNYSAETDSWTQYDILGTGQHLDVFDPFKNYVPSTPIKKSNVLTDLTDLFQF